MALWTRINLEYAIVDSGGIELLCLACESLDRAQACSSQITIDGHVIRLTTGRSASIP
jgi:hypothetical protein